MSSLNWVHEVTVQWTSDVCLSVCLSVCALQLPNTKQISIKCDVRFTPKAAKEISFWPLTVHFI
jgi:hypothetical protein